MTRHRKHRRLPWHKGGHRKRVPLCDRKVAGRFMEQVFGSCTILGIGDEQLSLARASALAGDMSFAVYAPGQPAHIYGRMK